MRSSRKEAKVLEEPLPCSHEETDVPSTPCAKDTVQKGCRKSWICRVDMDVVIPTITVYGKINPDELWIAIGSKLHFSYLYAYS